MTEGEINNLPMAYVLLNTEIGSERDVLKTLRSIEGVQEAFNLLGVYDIIAQIKAESVNKLTQIINEKLQISKVHSKLTIIATDNTNLALATM